MATKTGTSKRNILTGTSSADILSGLGGNDDLFGLAGNDKLDGGAGIDLLDGGAGRDNMKGGEGNDTYIVSQANDQVKELSGEGSDLVKAHTSFTLPLFVENLSLIGAAAVSGTGNGQNNIITGNSVGNKLFGLKGSDTLDGKGGNDALDGGQGADIMKGGAGNDIFFVDNIKDKVSDSSGTDTVRSSVGFVLPSKIEKLTLTGSASVNGTGNALDNAISGNAGDNVLLGKDGNDTLKSGGGNDTVEGGAGSDTLNGGTGTNTLSFAHAAGAVTASLLTGAGSAGEALGDVYSNFKDLRGSAFGDTLTGDNSANRIAGGGGSDVIDGLRGNDVLIGGAGADTFNFTGNSVATTTYSGFDTIENFEQVAGLGNGDIVRIQNVAGGAWNQAEIGGNTEFALTIGANPAKVATITIVGVTGMLAADDYIFFS